MSLFKNHKIGAKELLGLIPESLLATLSSTTNVDFYTKVLYGRKMFYLLLYGLLENERMSQRTLEDTFNDSLFKLLFNIDNEESITRSSISERLSKINIDFFSQAYQRIYQRFSNLYQPKEQEKYGLIRVDSSMVSETSKKLVEGMVSTTNNGRKSIKYTIGFDGLLPCGSKIYTEAKYHSEDLALPELIRSHLKEDPDHQNIYVFDRGLQSVKTIQEFSNESITFIGRVKENRKYVLVDSFIKENTLLDLGKLTLIQDSKVNLYRGQSVQSKKGSHYYQSELIKEPLRLIVAQNKATLQEHWFVSNNFDASPQEITNLYKQRWDIETVRRCGLLSFYQTRT